MKTKSCYDTNWIASNAVAQHISRGQESGFIAKIDSRNREYMRICRLGITYHSIPLRQVLHPLQRALVIGGSFGEGAPPIIRQPRGVILIVFILILFVFVVQSRPSLLVVAVGAVAGAARHV